MSQFRFVILCLAVVLIAMLRFALLDLSNFAPIAAAGIFGIYFFRKQQFGIPMALFALFLSDVVLQLSQGYGLYWARMIDYVGLALGLGLAYLLLRQKKSIGTTLGAAALGSLLFFIVSNLGVWAFGELYPKTVGGLITCFEMAIPFYWGTLVGDLYFTGLFIGCFEWITTHFPKLTAKTSKA